MKTIIRMISVSAACVLLCLCGCSGKPAPFYCRSTGETVVFYNKENLPASGRSIYETFLDYYDHRFAAEDRRFFLLEDVCACSAVSLNLEGTEYFANFRFYYSDPDYLDWYEYWEAGRDVVPTPSYETMELEYCAACVSSDTEGELRFEFGSCEEEQAEQSDRWFARKFVNVYAGDKCIGTFYYRPAVPVSELYLTNFFGKYLYLR